MRKNKAAAEIWLNKAKDHLTFAKAGWEESEIVSDTCVLCQQAAEKALEQNGKDIGGRALKVNMATEKPSRGRGGRSRW